MFLTAVSPFSLHPRTPKTPQEVKHALQSLPTISHTMSARNHCSALIGALRPHPPDETFSVNKAVSAPRRHSSPTSRPPIPVPTP